LSLNEFEVIQKYFNRPDRDGSGVVLGIGDDAAILRLEPGNDLVVTADTLNIGVHFPESTDPKAIAHKALAVNLSDVAAMGARPSWFTLSLSLPEVREEWLESFSKGLFGLADDFGVTLVGGDTIRGPLSVGIQLAGQLKADAGLKRSGAQIGDRIYVSGTIGDAACALDLLGRNPAIDLELRSRLDYPSPRVDLGLRLVEVANSCIDISDGLAADLGHILAASNVGASITTNSLPLSHYMRSLEAETALRYALAGGDDYELCFTVPPDKKDKIDLIGNELGIRLSHIGDIVNGTELRLIDTDIELSSTGYRHFLE